MGIIGDVRLAEAAGQRRSGAGSISVKMSRLKPSLGTALKIATWNVNSLAVRLPQLLDWLTLHQPDVLCLQETKLTDDKFPHAAIIAAGYHVQWFGQKT